MRFAFRPQHPQQKKPVSIIAGSFVRRQESVQTCGWDAMRGTSMATPIVAGSLLLIRQYFVEGWYPSGAPNSTLSYTPSGPLMKAVLLGGSDHPGFKALSSWCALLENIY